MFVVIFLDFFVANRGENFRRNVGADDFQRDLRRLGETGRRGRSVRHDVAVLFVKFLQFFFRRIRDFADVIRGVERDDVRLHRAVRRFERFGQVGGNDERARVVVTSDGAFVSDLLFQQVDQKLVVQTAGVIAHLPFFRGERTAEKRLQVLRRVGVARGQALVVSELQDQPTVDQGLRVGQSVFQLGRHRVETLRLRGFVAVFSRQSGNIELREIILGQILRHLSGFRPRFGVQRIERRLREFRQTRRRIVSLTIRVVIVISVLDRFRDFARRSALLSAGSDALHHRPQRDERKHRKESKPRHPSLLITAEYAKRIMFCHLNYLS